MKLIFETLATIFFLLSIAALITSVFAAAAKNFSLGGVCLLLGLTGFFLFYLLNMYLMAAEGKKERGHG
ncbi:hypothetical protein E4187_22260 (plasmid) [Aeromonas media]|uniref:hypothetical protein n=1 Tax=Aeromonas media TaxID=651 RepID=UPI00148B2D12|nr:hypothetical protein [Aeromonas media]QJT37020.1 hypothetical protein E4187_22260 [Aeromonas media]